MNKLASQYMHEWVVEIKAVVVTDLRGCFKQSDYGPRTNAGSEHTQPAQHHRVMYLDR